MHLIALPILGFKKTAEKAEQGDMYSQWLLGCAYAKGDYLLPSLPDDTKALMWFQKAAEQGCVEAQRCMGILYAVGRGTPRDDEMAVHCFQKAASRGDGEAQRCMGIMCATGKGVQQNFTEALEWFGRASTEGHDSLALECYTLLKWNIIERNEYSSEVLEQYFGSADITEPEAVVEDELYDDGADERAAWYRILNGNDGCPDPGRTGGHWMGPDELGIDDDGQGVWEWFPDY